MTVDVGLAPREGTPGAHLVGTCYACPEFPDGHPLVGDVEQHLRDIALEDDDA
jgi:hypothetical protein